MYTHMCVPGGGVTLISAPILSRLNQNPLMFIWGPFKIPMIILGIFIFLGIVGSNIHISKWVKYFSISVFEVYLLHNGPLLSLIVELFGIDKVSHNSMIYPFLILSSSVLIFVFGSIIAHIRMLLFHKMNKEKLEVVIIDKMEKLVERASTFSINIFFWLFKYKKE